MLIIQRDVKLGYGLEAELCGELAQVFSLVCGLWGPKGFKFGKARFYCSDIRDILK